MIDYIITLNIIKTAVTLKKKKIKIKINYKTKKLLKILKNINIVLNMWTEKNKIIVNLNKKTINNFKVKLFKKNLKKKELSKEINNSSSIFLLKNGGEILLLKKNLINNACGGFIFARIDF